MAAVPLPLSMPPPRASGHGVEFDDTADSTKMDSGHTRRRPGSRGRPGTVSVSWHLTQARFDDWYAWWQDEAGAGAEIVALPIADAGGSVVLTPALFLEPPKIDVQPESLTYVVNCKAMIGGHVASLAGIVDTGIPIPAPSIGTLAIVIPETPGFAAQGMVIVSGVSSWVEAPDVILIQQLVTRLGAMAFTDTPDTIAIASVLAGSGCLMHTLGSSAYVVPAGGAVNFVFPADPYVVPSAAGCPI